jgi:hypothetical protein
MPMAFTGAGYSVQSAVLPLTTSSPAAEEEIAMDPNNTCQMVGAISDFSIRGGFNTTKFSATYDFGVTWHEGFLPVSGTGVKGKVATGDLLFDANSDPVVAIDRGGRVYVSNLCFNSGKSPVNNPENGIYVAVKPLGSQASPLTFAVSDVHRVVANLAKNNTNFEDKPWMTVDNSNSSTREGNVYVTWTRFTSTDMIMFTRSTDHGVTWSAPVQVSDPSHNGQVQGSQVATAPNGDIYVFYEYSPTPPPGQPQQSSQIFVKSTNGGTTWSPAVAKVTGLFDLSFTASYRFDSFPSLAVGPVNGEIYVVYPDQPGTNSQIKFIRSTDGGATFSPPVAINDVSNGQRLMPAISADDQGGIHVSWFDTRNGGPDPANNTQIYDIYASRGTISGGAVVWSPNVRLTPSSVTVASTNGFIGDYGGICSGSLMDGTVLWGVAVPVWTGGAGSIEELQAAILAYNP